jgi:DNA primase
MRESILERRIKRYAESKECFFWKFISPQVKGVPDRLLVTPNGDTAFMEIKAPGEKPNKIQEHRMQQLRGQGIPAIWVDNYDTAVGFINGLLSPRM